jgi:hypothetical protein
MPMGGGNSRQRRRFERALKRESAKVLGTSAATEMPLNPVSSAKPLREALLDFIEHPLFLFALGILGGVVGFLYTPVLMVCGLCIVLAFHRAKVVSGRPLVKVQLPAYALVFGLTFAGLYLVRITIPRKLRDDIRGLAAQTASDVLSGLSNNSPKQAPPQQENRQVRNQQTNNQIESPEPVNSAAAQIADEVAKRLAGTKVVPKRGEEIYAEVLGAAVDQMGQFYQHPPVYFKKLDTGLYVSLTNQADYQIYLRRYSVSAAVNGKLVRFENPDPDVAEPDAFGIIDNIRMRIARFDLSQNGFDYVMGQHPLGAHENANLWMFFLTGTKDLKELAGTIDKFTITFYDSTNKTYRCVAPFRKGAISIGNRTLPPTTHVDIRFLDAEPIPADLREEPKANRPGP